MKQIRLLLVGVGLLLAAMSACQANLELSEVSSSTNDSGPATTALSPTTSESLLSPEPSSSPDNSNQPRATAQAVSRGAGSPEELPTSTIPRLTMVQSPKFVDPPPPDLVSHINWLSGGGGPNRYCPDDLYELSWSTDYAHLTTTRIAVDSIAEVTKWWGMVEFPAVCIRDADIAHTVVVVSPDGVEYNPLMNKTYPDPQGDDFITGVWLPLEALAQPGVWKYRILESEAVYEIVVPETDEPSFVVYDSMLWVGGFAPNQEVIGVVFQTQDYVGAIRFRVDEKGYALVRTPLLTIEGSDFLASTKTTLILLSESGDIAFSPDLSEVWLVGDNFPFGDSRQMKDLVPSLYEYYWGRDNTASSTSLCGEAPEPRLVPLERGQVTINNGLSVRLREGPGFSSLSSSVVGLMPEGTQFEVLGGPVCRDGYWWWYVEPENGFDFLGVRSEDLELLEKALEKGSIDVAKFNRELNRLNRAWAMEGDDTGYFLEPID